MMLASIAVSDWFVSFLSYTYNHNDLEHIYSPPLFDQHNTYVWSGHPNTQVINSHPIKNNRNTSTTTSVGVSIIKSVSKICASHSVPVLDVQYECSAVDTGSSGVLWHSA